MSFSQYKDFLWQKRGAFDFIENPKVSWNINQVPRRLQHDTVYHHRQCPRITITSSSLLWSHRFLYCWSQATLLASTSVLVENETFLLSTEICKRNRIGHQLHASNTSINDTVPSNLIPRTNILLNSIVQQQLLEVESLASIDTYYPTTNRRKHKPSVHGLFLETCLTAPIIEASGEKYSQQNGA